MSEKKQEQPKAVKVRGFGTYRAETGEFDFRPSGEGTPSKKEERKKGKSSFYKTNGEKESSIVAHLRVDADCEDPVAQLYEDLAYFTKGMTQKEAPLPRSKKLYEKPGVTVWHRQKEQKLVVQMEISTDGTQELSGQLFNLTAEVNKCLAINKTSLLPREK